ncbi:cation transporter [Bacillus sp. AK031]
MEEMTLYVKEATNRASIQTLETALLDLNGIERALVDTAVGEVKVTYDQAKITPHEVEQKIQQLGMHLR